MDKRLKVLIIEDSEDDALLLLMQLREAGYTPEYKIAETAKTVEEALGKQEWDIVISDYVLPEFSGLAALQLLRERHIDLPCIIVSGKITDETAVSAMKAGARDYIMKDNLRRLGPAIERELLEAEVRRERSETREKLKESEEYFQAIFENAQDVILVINPDSTIRYGNPAMKQLSGFRSEEVVGKKVFDFLHPEDLEGVLQIFNRGITVSDHTDRLEIRLKHKDGSWRNAEVVARNALKNPAVSGLILNIRDITERKRFEQELEFYARRVVEVQEEERKRIARELHDDTAPSLAYLGLELESIVEKNPGLPAETLRRLQPLKGKIDIIQQDIRRFSHELHPAVLENLGLEAALETLTEEINALEHVEVLFEVAGTERRLPDEANLALYRITQEALNNVQKHSGATRATVNLEYAPQKTILSIADNGRGFDLAAKREFNAQGGLGLIGMKERAQLVGANLKTKSAIGKGTTVTVEVPQ